MQEEAVKEADEAAEEYVEADEDEDEDEEEEDIQYVNEDELDLGEVSPCTTQPYHSDQLLYLLWSSAACTLKELLRLLWGAVDMLRHCSRANQPFLMQGAGSDGLC